MAALTPEMRAEITDILRASGPGLTHGAVFASLEQGLSAEQIAAARNTGVAYVRQVIASLNNLFDASSVPASRSAALLNSQVYRELLNHHLSPELRDYVDARLTALQAVHPDVGKTPLRTRTKQHAPRRSTPAPPSRETACPSCGLTHAGDCF